MSRKILKFETSTSFNEKNPKLDSTYLDFKPTGENYAILFGWFGSTPRLISKYSILYKKKGFDIISYYPIPDIGMKNIQRDVSEFVYQIDYLLKSHGKKSILIHAFSIGGATFGALLKQIYGDYRLHYMIPLIKGCIFDSSPPYTPEGGTNAMHYVLRLSYYTYPYLLLLPFYKKYYTNLSELYKFQFSPFNHWDYLFFYSKDDKIVLSSDVEKLIRDLKSHDKNVEVHSWEKSQHTTHLKNYPEEYTKYTNDFIDRFLKKSIQSSL